MKERREKSKGERGEKGSRKRSGLLFLATRDQLKFRKGGHTAQNTREVGLRVERVELGWRKQEVGSAREEENIWEKVGN